VSRRRRHCRYRQQLLPGVRVDAEQSPCTGGGERLIEGEDGDVRVVVPAARWKDTLTRSGSAVLFFGVSEDCSGLHWLPSAVAGAAVFAPAPVPAAAVVAQAPSAGVCVPTVPEKTVPRATVAGACPSWCERGGVDERHGDGRRAVATCAVPPPEPCIGRGDPRTRTWEGCAVREHELEASRRLDERGLVEHEVDRGGPGVAVARKPEMLTRSGAVVRPAVMVALPCCRSPEGRPPWGTAGPGCR
jgi:hypothetical protein